MWCVESFGKQAQALCFVCSFLLTHVIGYVLWFLIIDVACIQKFKTLFWARQKKSIFETLTLDTFTIEDSKL
jgi:hypothetical protein